jgi:hypothetical protein
VPTSRPRYTVTETDALARALEEVARTHPELEGDRNALFRRLVEEATARYDGAARRDGVRAALARIEARDLNYPAGYLADLRAEWPA